MAEIVILGAGLTGLSCAYHLEKKGFFNFKIFEKNSSPGGLLRSFNQNNFTFDFTGHLLHINNDYFFNFINSISNIDNFNLVERNTAIYINKNLTPYPIQINLSGLSKNIIINSIYGFINRKKQIKQPQNYYQWILKHFGSGLGKHFFFPYNKKILSYNVKKITPSWTGRFVPKTDLKTMLKAALGKNIVKNVGYNFQFYYPKSGGIEFLIKQLLKKLKCPIYTNYRAEKIDLKNKIIYFTNGHKEKFEKLINTIPLNCFLKSLKEKSNTTFKNAANKLLCNSVINFNLGFNTRNIGNKHWIYYPEKKYPFYRIGFWHNINKNSTPTNYTAIYGETSYLPKTKTKKQIYNLTEKSIKKSLNVLELKKSNIITQKILHIPHAYVIYNFWREKNLKKLLKRLKELSVYTIGRYGEWKYSSMQEAVLDSKKVVDELLSPPNYLKIPARTLRSFDKAQDQGERL